MLSRMQKLEQQVCLLRVFKVSIPGEKSFHQRLAIAERLSYVGNEEDRDYSLQRNEEE